MEDSFVTVRRISHSLDRGRTCHSSSGAWLGRGVACVCAQKREHHSRNSFDLTPAQEDCLQRLQSRVYIPYDSCIPQHQEALRALWKLAFPEEQLHGMISEQWKGMGWQGKDPSTDFRYQTSSESPLYLISTLAHAVMPDDYSWRGGGFISLENLLYFARNLKYGLVFKIDEPMLKFPICSVKMHKSFQQLRRKQVGDRSVWEYPFAIAGVNITFMLIQMLELEPGLVSFYLQKIN